MALKARIQNKIDTTTNWAAAVNFKPLKGEIVIYSDAGENSTPRFKIGDGETLVSALPFVDEYITIEEIDEICQ